MYTRVAIILAALVGALSSPFAIAAAASAPEASAFDATQSIPKFEFARVKSIIAVGDQIGFSAKGMFCFGRREVRATARLEEINNAEAALAFKAELLSQGLAAPDADVSAFDNGAGNPDPDYRIGGVLQALMIDECTSGNDHKGTISITVKWEVFAPKLQKVVLSKVTTGEVTSDRFEKITGRDFESHAYRNALHQLITDAAFKALQPVEGPGVATMSVGDAARSATLHLKPAQPLAGGTQANAPALRQAVATVLHDNMSGSGFYVADGYLLTNRHVVNTAHYVKVKLASGRTLVGEVIREDARRDVALVKTEPAGVRPLHVDMGEAPVGEDVFAIGSPLGQDLAGTFTRGVLSGTRQINGLEYLQSDAAVNPGNSGGPLLDATSTAIGMTVLKIEKAAGLSFFIPIRDVANALNLVFD